MKVIAERKVTAEVTTLEVSAREWQLFTHDKDLKRGSEIAAKAMNKALVDSVNAGGTREETYNAVSVVAGKHRKGTGSCDTEPRQVLSYILDKIYGEE